MKRSTNYIVKVALLSTIAFILMAYLEFPLPLFPAFLKFDVSNLPALIGGFALGPLAGAIIVFLKNIFHFIFKSDGTGGVGNLSNFLVGAAFVLPASVIYIKNRTKKGAIYGIIAGIISKVFVSSLTNYYIIIPLYSRLMPIEKIIEMAAMANTKIVDIKTYIIYAVIPFNFIQGVVLSAITLAIYKKISPILRNN
ncbi:MAG: ECF transporter S component [Clostridiales bacterium]|nr:ECF transporter S component [Clostridiales bacterium]